MKTAVHSGRNDALATFAALFGLLAWDAVGLDMPMAAWFGGPLGFPWRAHWLLAEVLHRGGRALAWGAVSWLCLAVWRPGAALQSLEPARRLQLALTPLLAALLVASIKSFSATSCPWDLAAFGGLAQHLPHWPWASLADGGSGRCFPAGQASAGFGFIGGWFVWRDRAPRLARVWLAGALAGGLLLGLAQQARGAHFMSHTLWSAWLCWCAALAVDLLRMQWQRRSALQAATA